MISIKKKVCYKETLTNNTPSDDLNLSNVGCKQQLINLGNLKDFKMT